MRKVLRVLCALSPFLVGVTSAAEVSAGPLVSPAARQMPLASQILLAVHTADVYKDIFEAIQLDPLVASLRRITGYDPVTVNGETFKISARDNEADKKHFREYYIHYFQTLGIPVRELPFKTKLGEGANVEAVLEGKSKDSIIVISHYDSAGEPNNPAVDDAASGIAIMMETARILKGYQGSLDKTIRFIVADNEETNQSGDHYYGEYIIKIAAEQNFKPLVAIDFDQSGWLSRSNNGNQIDVDINKKEGADPWVTLFLDTMRTYSDLEPRVSYGYTGVDTDFLDPAEIVGICPSEKDGNENPYKDKAGDTLETLTLSYYLRIAKLGAAYVAKAAGIAP